MLSITNSIYEPFGFTSPFVPEGRQLLESLCHQDMQWDATVIEALEKLEKQRIKWEMKLMHIESLQIIGCLKPPAFGRRAETIIHFSDTSEDLSILMGRYNAFC